MINSIFEVEEFDYTTQYVVKKIVLLNKHYPDGIFFSREGTQFSIKDIICKKKMSRMLLNILERLK